MSAPEPSSAGVYAHPRYYAIGYQWNTKGECDFLEAALAEFSGRKARRILDIGCGAGRHLLELAKRGYQMSGFDVHPEMVAYVREEATRAGVSVSVEQGDLRRMTPAGTFDAAVCLMDTFRFLLTNDDIVEHLRRVGQHLSAGGLYVTDFWIPTRWDQIANEIHQWEQTEGRTTVRVFYLQHPESVDPVHQTFEDELVFAVEDGEQSREIRGTRARTRLLMPQEFRALVEVSGCFDIAGTFSEFDLDKPLEPSSMSWRMITVLKKRA